MPDGHYYHQQEITAAPAVKNITTCTDQLHDSCVRIMSGWYNIPEDRRSPCGNFNIILVISHALLGHFSASPIPTRAVAHALLSGHAYRMLIGACDLMLWPIHLVKVRRWDLYRPQRLDPGQQAARAQALGHVDRILDLGLMLPFLPHFPADPPPHTHTPDAC